MTTKLSIGIALVAFAAACGTSHGPTDSSSSDVTTSAGSAADMNAGTAGSSTTPTGTIGGAGTTTSGTLPAPPELPGTAGLYVRGVNNSGFTSLSLAIKKISVEVDGTPVTVDTTFMQLPDFSREISWRVGSMPLPAPGADVTITIAFDIGGSWVGSAGTGSLIAWTEPMTFHATGHGLALRDHVVAHVDVDRSFIDGCSWMHADANGCAITPNCSGQVAFVPDFGVHY